VPLQHVSFDQTAPGKPESSRTKKRLHDFNPAAPEKRIVDPNRYAALVHELSLCQPDVPFLTIADGSQWASNSPQPCHHSVNILPGTVAEFDSILLPAATVNVVTSETDPKSVLELAEDYFTSMLSQGCSDLSDKIQEAMTNIFVLSHENQQRIEQITMGQHLNPSWHHYRKAVITGTLINAVRTRMDSITKGRATLLMLNGLLISVYAMFPVFREIRTRDMVSQMKQLQWINT